MEPKKSNALVKAIVQLNFLFLGLAVVGYLMFSLKTKGLSPSVLEMIGVKSEVSSEPIKAQLIGPESSNPVKNPEKSSSSD